MIDNGLLRHFTALKSVQWVVENFEPFISTEFVMKQQVFDKDVPTPLLLYDFLQKLSVSLIPSTPSDDDENEDYNPWRESKDSRVPVRENSIHFAHNNIVQSISFRTKYFSRLSIFCLLTVWHMKKYIMFQSCWDSSFELYFSCSVCPAWYISWYFNRIFTTKQWHYVFLILECVLFWCSNICLCYGG